MKKIILIDDDDAILDAVSLVLTRAGYKVEMYHKADKLIDELFIEPDLFLIDKQLSGVDGLDLCRFLKNRSAVSTTPVIIFSASPMIRGAVFEAGADDFLEKPFQSKTLVNMVAKHLS
jgi:DNA-binding response OmpR family regulator